MPDEVELTERHSRDAPASDLPRKPTHVDPKMRPLNLNTYATKKTVAQGMLDIALLTANASQLKYVLQVGPAHEFYYPLVSMISISIILQVIIGFGFLALGLLDVTSENHQYRANLINNVITGGVFVVTILNVLISAFGMKESDDVEFKETNTKPKN